MTGPSVVRIFFAPAFAIQPPWQPRILVVRQLSRVCLFPTGPPTKPISIPRLPPQASASRVVERVLNPRSHVHVVDFPRPQRQAICQVDSETGTKAASNQVGAREPGTSHDAAQRARPGC